MDMHGVAEAAALGSAARIRSTVPLAALSVTRASEAARHAPALVFAISGDLLAIGASTAATRLQRAR